jgi:hypothetical protein
MIFVVFYGIFPESLISAQKQDTRAILLKIVLVRVSCIQNTQIRGETTAKVFGKVDMFWTYQSFTVWGLDMVGPFRTTPGGLTHLLVAVD